MTVNDLIKALMLYPGEMNVKVAIRPRIKDIDYLNTCVNMETNKSSLVIYGDGEYWPSYAHVYKNTQEVVAN